MFASYLKFMLIDNGKYHLIDDLVFEASSYIITVYSGFIWNGANIPTSLQSIVGCPMDYAYESCLHDALYASKLFSRKDCDKLFHKALLARGVDEALAKAMYLAVRLGGEQNYGGDAIYQAREFVSVRLK